MKRDARGILKSFLGATFIVGFVQAELMITEHCNLPAMMAIPSMIIYLALGMSNHAYFRTGNQNGTGITAGVAFGLLIVLRRLAAANCRGEAPTDRLFGTIAISIVVGAIAGILGSYFCARQYRGR